MKITQSQLRKLIKEELKAVLGESMQKMLGLPHQYTTQDLATAVQGLIKSPREDMTPNSDQAAAVEKLISNHIRDKGTPEEKDALKKLRDDFLKSIGSVYRGHMVTGAHAGQTRYEKSRQSRGDAAKRRAEMQESAMNEGESDPAADLEAEIGAKLGEQSSRSRSDLDAIMNHYTTGKDQSVWKASVDAILDGKSNAKAEAATLIDAFEQRFSPEQRAARKAVYAPR